MIKTSKQIKVFQVKHVFSGAVCNAWGQGGLRNVRAVITLTPNTLGGWEKGTPGSALTFSFFLYRLQKWNFQCWSSETYQCFKALWHQQRYSLKSKKRGRSFRRSLWFLRGINAFMCFKSWASCSTSLWKCNKTVRKQMHVPAPRPSGMLIRVAQQSARKGSLITGHARLCHEHNSLVRGRLYNNMLGRHVWHISFTFWNKQYKWHFFAGMFFSGIGETPCHRDSSPPSP